MVQLIDSLAKEVDELAKRQIAFYLLNHNYQREEQQRKAKEEA